MRISAGPSPRAGRTFSAQSFGCLAATRGRSRRIIRTPPRRTARIPFQDRRHPPKHAYPPRPVRSTDPRGSKRVLDHTAFRIPVLRGRPSAPPTHLATFTYHRRRRDRPSGRRGTRFRLRPDTARPAFAGPGPVSSGTLYRGPGRRLPPTETASVRHPGPAFSRARSDGLPPAEAASSLAAAARAAGTTRHVAACADPPEPPAAGGRDDQPGPGIRDGESRLLRPPRRRVTSAGGRIILVGAFVRPDDLPRP